MESAGNHGCPQTLGGHPASPSVMLSDLSTYGALNSSGSHGQNAVYDFRTYEGNSVFLTERQVSAPPASSEHRAAEGEGVSQQIIMYQEAKKEQKLPQIRRVSRNENYSQSLSYGPLIYPEC